MGAVNIDIHKRGREYEDLTLSDENVVKYIILFRSKVDVSYGASTNIDINQAGDTFEFNAELISLYMSLDRLIDKVKMKDKDWEFLKLVFSGYTLGDIIEVYKYPRKTAYRTLDRIVSKIVDANDLEWKKMMQGKGYIE